MNFKLLTLWQGVFVRVLVASKIHCADLPFGKPNYLDFAVGNRSDPKFAEPLDEQVSS